MFKSVFCFERKFDLLKRTFDLLCMLFLFRSMLRAGKTVSKPVHTGVFNCYESKLLSTVFQAWFFCSTRVLLRTRNPYDICAVKNV